MINNNELINEIKFYNKFLNHDSLNKAFKFAIDAHKNQKRDEGVPYIIHPVAVAKILTDLKLDSATITNLNVSNLEVDSAHFNVLSADSGFMNMLIVDSANVNNLSTANIIMSGQNLDNLKRFTVKNEAGTIIIDGYMLSTSNNPSTL